MTKGILLAAGGASRFGRPKQLEPVGREHSLLSHVTAQLDQAGCTQLIVVLGAFRNLIRKDLQSRLHPLANRLWIIENPDWERGQSGSLQTGLRHAREIGDVSEPCLITLCDIPAVPVRHYRSLIADLDDTQHVASVTNFPEGVGVPACFTAAALDELQLLPGDQGAKTWLRRQDKSRLRIHRCEAASRDIDREQDLRWLAAR